MNPFEFSTETSAPEECTNTIIISKDEFMNQAAEAIAKSGLIQSSPFKCRDTMVELAAIFIELIKEELFGEGGENK